MKPINETILFQPGQSFNAFKRIDQKFDFCWHIHNEYEIVYMLKGNGRRFIGNVVEEYNSPELVFIPPAVSHTWESAPNSLNNEAFVIHFQKNGFGKSWFKQNELSELAPLFENHQSFVIKNPPPLHKYFAKMIQENKLTKALNLLALLDLINNSEKIILGEHKETSPTLIDSRLAKIITWINQNFQRDFSLPELAEKHNLSPYQLRTLFQKNIKKSLLEYTNEIRIYHSCNLLQNKNLTINEVAFNTGFKNLSYFNRIFIKTTTLTPSQYRKQFSPKL